MGEGELRNVDEEIVEIIQWKAYDEKWEGVDCKSEQNC